MHTFPVVSGPAARDVVEGCGTLWGAGSCLPSKGANTRSPPRPKGDPSAPGFRRKACPSISTISGRGQRLQIASHPVDAAQHHNPLPRSFSSHASHARSSALSLDFFQFLCPIRWQNVTRMSAISPLAACATPARLRPWACGFCPTF